MKKSTLAIAAVAFILTGCGQELEFVPVNPTTNESNIVTLKANYSEPETKLSIDGYKAFAWQAGDVVSVLDNTGAPNEFTTTGSGTSVDFKGALSGTLGKYAMYPASDGHIADGDEVIFNLPTELTWSADATNMPMLGKISAGVGTFKAVGGVLKLICYNIPTGASYMWFVSSNSKITGDFTIADASVESPVITTSSASDDILQINFAYSANKVFYIPLPTGEIDGFTVQFYDSSDNELFSKTTAANFTVSRNQMTIGPALNCSVVLWSEDWSAYKADDVPSGSVKGYGSTDISYSVTNGAGTTKIYTESNAGGTSPELLVGKTKGTFVASNIPTDGAGSMILTFKHTKTVELSATSGITLSKSKFTDDPGDETVTLTNTESLANFDLTFTATTSSNVRLDDIKIVKSYTGPAINTSSNTLTIGVGYLSNTMTVNLANAVDELPVAAIVSDNDWIDTAEISGNKLTVTAKAANTNASDNEATITLKATGATKEITVKQTSALVQKPASISGLPGNGTVTASWTKDAHATGYVAYLCTSTGLADPTATGTELTPELDGSTYTVTKSELTNGTNYYVYVKVDAVASNYVADAEWAVSEAITPDNTTYYEKVTSNLDDWSGSYLIVWDNNVHYGITANGLVTNASVSIADGKIASSGHDSHKVTIEKVSSEYYIKLPNGKYITNASGSNTCTESEDKEQAYTFSISGGKAIITGAGDKILQKNSGYYRFYNNNDSYTKPELYRYNDPRTPAGIEWRKSGSSTSTDTATILTGDDTMPTATLYNPNSLSVEYSSSNPSVATINASTGAITLVGDGETEITASFADGDATYRPATVSYTLTVTDSRTTVATPTFSDVTEVYPDVNVLAAAKSITISCGTAGATVYYTTDNSAFNPSTWTAGTSVAISELTTVRAIAVKDDYKNSEEAIVSYRIAGSTSPLSEPSNVTITAISATSFTATWSNDVNASSYEWMLSTASTAPASTSDASVVSYGTSSDAALSAGIWTLTKTSLALSGKYYFYVKAKGDGSVYDDSVYSKKSAITLLFDVKSNPGGWPTTNSTTLTDYTYTLNTVNYTFKLYNVKQNSGYLMLTSTAGLGLPAISGYKLGKVIANNSSGCSTSTNVGISSTAPTTATYISGGSTQTWSKTSSSYTYNLSGTSANTVYYLYVTSKNAQLYSVELSYFE